MMRIFLHYVLPLLLPTLMYLAWIIISNRKRATNGEAPSLISEGPWFRLILAGFGLMLIGLAVTAVFGGMGKEGKYQSPYLENGKVVPGRMIPDDTTGQSQ